MNTAISVQVKYDLKYGNDQFNTGDLYFPKENPKCIICLLHGGFWKMPYDKTQMNPIAEKLASLRYAVWNIEYRRVDYPGSGFPGTFDDVVNAINYLENISLEYSCIHDLPIIIVGHSAGGHLALWINSNVERLFRKPDLIIGLAPVVDMEKSFNCSSRKDFVYNFLKSSPQDNMELYSLTSPILLRGSNLKQIIIHGLQDEILPINEIEDYVKTIMDSGGDIEMYKIKNGSHMDFLNPESESIKLFIEIIRDKFAYQA